MTDEPQTGSCELCKRTDRHLMTEYRPGTGMAPRVICADKASCVRARIQRDACAELDGVRQRVGLEQAGRSAWRDEAEKHIDLADRSLGGATGAAQVRATQAVAYALLAVAEAITQAPASDLVGVLDAGLAGLRTEASQLMAIGEAYEAGRHDASG